MSGWSDILISWLALRRVSGGNERLVKASYVKGLPPKLKRGKLMTGVYFPVEPLTICRYGWETPVYIEFKGAVRAIRLKRAEIYVERVDEYGNVRWNRQYVAKVAGMEKEQVFDCMPDFAETAEDFARGKIHELASIRDSEEIPTEQVLRDCFGEHATIERYDLTRTDFYWRAIRYKWDRIKPVPYHFKVKNFITFDGTHFHMDIGEMEPGTWPDEESCRRDNRPEVMEL